MNQFEKVFKALNKNKVKYLVVGGVAVNLYGYMRFTADLDILILLEEENLQKLSKIMNEMGYQTKIPISIMELKNHKQVRKWLKEKNMKAFSFMPTKNNPLIIDVIMEESLKFDKISSDKIIKKISNISIPIISIDNLIKMKKKANRAQDIMDLKALIEFKSL